MKIFNLTSKSKIFTSNVYLVTGTWNAMENINTLIDTGRDPSIIDEINAASTGLGKRRVEQVVLTHSHYDHASLLPRIHEMSKPFVCAFSRSLSGVDYLLKDGETLKAGDRIFEVIHTPGHSNDSICLYCEKEGVLFVGDTPVSSAYAAGSYEQKFLQALEKLCRRDIRSIYFGHGPPMHADCNKRIRASLKAVRKAIEPGRDGTGQTLDRSKNDRKAKFQFNCKR